MNKIISFLILFELISRPITGRIFLFNEEGCDDIYKELINWLCRGIKKKQTYDLNVQFNQKKESDDNNS